MPKPVKIMCENGPIRIEEVNGTLVDNHYDLWDGIKAREEFPSTGEGYYILTLSKSVTTLDEVDDAEKRLEDALACLSHAWPFADGNIMMLEKVKIETYHVFRSNAAEVKNDMLAEQGIKEVSARIANRVELCATCRCLPLENAVKICLKSRGDENLRRLLECYYKAFIAKESWFVHLYKIIDVLKGLFDSDKKVKNVLGIDSKEWAYFEQLFNEGKYDLRHAPQRGHNVEKLSGEKVEDLRKIAFKWIIKYMEHIGMDLSYLE